MMAGLKLWFVLLLSLIFYVESKGSTSVTLQHVKINGKEPYFASVCRNKTEDIIIILVCTIMTERHRGSQCKLVYQHGKDLENSCDSSFRFMTENQTMFLHLSNLKPEDGVNFTCHCSRPDGTFRVNVSVTVEEDEIASSSSEAHFPYVVIGVIIFFVISGVILGLLCRKTCNGRQQEANTRHPDVEPGDIEPHSTFMQRQNELYSFVNFPSLQRNARNSRVFTADDTYSGIISF